MGTFPIYHLNRMMTIYWLYPLHADHGWYLACFPLTLCVPSSTFLHLSIE